VPLKIILAFARAGQLRLMAAGMRLMRVFYRLCWLASAAKHGVLAALAGGPVSLEGLAAELAPEAPDALEVWLQLGVELRELDSTNAGYALRGFLARRLADPANDAISAMLQEMTQLHHRLIMETPELLRRGQKWTLADQDGELVARSSRTVEPALFDAIDRSFARSGAQRLLEVGAGSGIYIRYAAERNPQLEALGLELQPDVAEAARANLRQWGLEERARVEEGDIRERTPEAVFDAVTLHNNIYYFPVDERVALLTHLRGFLKPNGLMLLTTGCQGGSPAMVVLDLWSRSTQGCGRLPEVEEMQDQLRQAGFTSVEARSLLPTESYYAFTGRRR
jgi:SAM-dependent methyltransferase